MDNAVIELKKVTFSANNMCIVRDFSFQFEEGKAAALAGPPGGGKSTVLKLAAGLLIPSQGEAFYQGVNIQKMTRKQNMAFRKDSAFVFQDSALWANQDLHQILELPLLIHFPDMSRSERNNRINEVLAEVGYRKEVFIRPSLLSMGEQKLIAFARALICRPRLLFLDEWTESLDEAGARRLVSLVRKQKKAGHTVLFVSHDFRIIRGLADYIIMVLGGQFYLRINMEQLNNDPELAEMVEEGIG
jgi:ABC-type multidrug transport system ATPase subunit